MYSVFPSTNISDPGVVGNNVIAFIPFVSDKELCGIRLKA